MKISRKIFLSAFLLCCVSALPAWAADNGENKIKETEEKVAKEIQNSLEGDFSSSSEDNALKYTKDRFDLQKKLEEARNGSLEAQNELGEYYASGGSGDFPPNYQLANQWWTLSANSGYPPAIRNLGCAYYSGQGTLADVHKASRLWQVAAKLGDADAQYFTGMAYCNGLGFFRDVYSAVFWWQKAAEQGQDRAQCNLAYAYARGEGGVEKDIKKAFSLWQAAASKNNSVAQVALGLCFFTGDGAPKDEARAVKIWEIAYSESASLDAAKYLGLCYALGRGVEKDEMKALGYYTFAANRGDEESQKAVEELKLKVITAKKALIRRAEIAEEKKKQKKE